MGKATYNEFRDFGSTHEKLEFFTNWPFRASCALWYCCPRDLFPVFEFQVRQWRSRADRVLTLNMNIRLLLFSSTWSLSRARGPDSATMTWRIGSDYSFYIASEQKRLDWLGHSSCDSLNCRKYWKNSGTRWGFFNRHSPAQTVSRLNQASLQENAHRTSHSCPDFDAMCCTSHAESSSVTPLHSVIIQRTSNPAIRQILHSRSGNLSNPLFFDD